MTPAQAQGWLCRVFRIHNWQPTPGRYSLRLQNCSACSARRWVPLAGDFG